MTLIYMDGFDNESVGTSSPKLTSYGGGSGTVATSSTTPYGVGQSLSLTRGVAGGNNALVAYKTFPVSYSGTLLYAGCNYWNVGNESGVLTFYNSSLGPQLTLWVSFGTYGVNRGSTQMVSVAFTNSGWNNFGFVAYISTTVGWYEVYLNGVLGTSYYGTGNSRATANGNTQNVANANVDLLAMGGTKIGNWGTTGSQGNTTFYLDDVYMGIGSGTTNTDYPGPVRISTIYPTGPGSYAQFTQTGGTGGTPYTAVNEIPPNGDTSYLASNTQNNIHSFATGDIPAGATVYAVQTNLYAKKDDAGTRYVAPFIKQGTGEAIGPTVLMTDTYLLSTALMETDPTTSTAWTGSTVNSAEFGVKVTT